MAGERIPPGRQTESARRAYRTGHVGPRERHPALKQRVHVRRQHIRVEATQLIKGQIIGEDNDDIRAFFGKKQTAKTHERAYPKKSNPPEDCMEI